ncbi:MAG: IPTL-CTERM sorting domain-containing protein [Pseudomonadota bacterium]
MISCIKNYSVHKTQTKVILFSAFLSLLLIHPLFADAISTTDKYAYAENAGWLDFSSTHEQATVYNDHLEGYVWSEVVGWIRLGTYTAGDSHSYANNASNTYGVNNDGSGNLSGYGWSENSGWLNFNSNHGQVTIDAASGDFDGYAWSESIGWVHFQNVVPAYKVQRTLDPTYVPDPGHPGGSISFSAAGQTLSSIFITAANGSKPAGMSSPFGKASYQVTSPIGGTATVRLTFSTALPATFSVYKVDNAEVYTPIPQDAGADGFWHQVDENTVEVTLKDGGAYDLDGAADGSILDPVVVLVNAVAATAIPTLSFWGLLLLTGLIGWFAVHSKNRENA